MGCSITRDTFLTVSAHFASVQGGDITVSRSPFEVTLQLSQHRWNLRRLENIVATLKSLPLDSETPRFWNSPARKSANGSRRSRSQKGGSTTSSVRSAARSNRR